MEKYRLEHSDVVLTNVHSSTSCLGEYCTVHKKSDHHMRSFPQHWRSDWGFMERMCSHGIGHPDPDECIDKNNIVWRHGCDGCCFEDKS